MGLMGLGRQIANDFGALLTRLKREYAALDGKTARITSQYNEWFQKELARGATVSTVPPQEVTDALEKVRRERLSVGRKFLSAQQGDLDAETASWVARVETAGAAFVATVGGARNFERARNQFIAACGGTVPAPLFTNDVIDTAAFGYWKERAARIVNPPARRQVQRPEDNRLILTD